MHPLTVLLAHALALAFSLIGIGSLAWLLASTGCLVF